MNKSFINGEHPFEGDEGQPELSQDAIQSMQTMAVQPQWVTTPEQLQGLIAHWKSQDLLAIDTEFVRTRTYYAQPGLIQIADAQTVYLIDPLQLTDLKALGELLRAPRPLKILHSMTEDILLLHRMTGEIPVHVYDTQIAECFLGASSSLSFQRFVQQKLGILLDKTETRSDWTARPLSEEQILYAAQDVVYLMAAMQRQLEQVRAQDLYESVLEECEAWVQQIIAAELDDENGYLRVRGGWDLNPMQQRVLKQLVSFRDRRAKEKDVPKSWVLDDLLLLQIARRSPENLRELQSVKDIKESTIRRLGERLILLVQAAKQAGDGEPFDEIDAPVAGNEVPVFKKMKALADKRGPFSGFPTSLLAPKKQLEQLLIQVLRKKGTELTPFFSGWRKDVIGDDLLALLNGAAKSMQLKSNWKSGAATEWIFCSVYKSSRKQGMYLYVERKDGCEELPEALRSIFGTPIHVLDMVLTPVKLLARANAREVMDKIAEQGFYLQMPPAFPGEQIGDVPAPNDSLHG